MISKVPRSGARSEQPEYGPMPRELRQPGYFQLLGLCENPNKAQLCTQQIELLHLVGIWACKTCWEDREQ